MSAPLHLGLIAPDLREKHGWGTYTVHLIHALREAGVRLTVVAARNTPPLPGVDVHPLLPNVAPRQRLFLPALFAALPASRSALSGCTVIHATAEPYAPLAAAIAGKRPLCITGHGSYVRYDRAFRPPQLYKWAFERGTLVCVSRYTAAVAQALMPNARTVVVNNGVDVARYAQLPPLSTLKSGPTVLTVGALKQRKGNLELVQAMAQVVQQVPDAQCVLIGSTAHEPEYVARIRAEIERLDLTAHIHLLGQVPDDVLLGWYGAADVFALPSMNSGWRFEGFGLTLIEASAAGLPVVGARGSGNEDAVDDGVTGFLVMQENVVDELAAALVRLLTDPTLAAQMGEAGRAKARRMTWDETAQQMLALYEGMAR